MRLLFILSFLSSVLFAKAPSVTILCYYAKDKGVSTDPTVEQLCATQKRRLSKCGFDAQIVSNATAFSVRMKSDHLKKEKAPVVIAIGHGKCMTPGENHIFSMPGSPTKDALTEDLAREYKIINPNSTFLAASCQAGGFCEDCRCNGADCSVGSVTGANSSAAFQTSTNFGEDRLHVVDQFIDLLCDPNLFQKYAKNCVMGEKEFENYYRDTVSIKERKFSFEYELNEMKYHGGKGGVVSPVPYKGSQEAFEKKVAEDTAKIRASEKFKSTKSKLDVQIKYAFYTYCQKQTQVPLVESQHTFKRSLEFFGWFPNLKDAQAHFDDVLGKKSACRVIETPSSARAEFFVKEPFDLNGKPAYFPSLSFLKDKMPDTAAQQFEALYLGKPIKDPVAAPPSGIDDKQGSLFSVDNAKMPSGPNPNEAASKQFVGPPEPIKAMYKMDPVEMKNSRLTNKDLASLVMAPDYKSMKLRHPKCEPSSTNAYAPRSGSRQEDAVEVKSPPLPSDGVPSDGPHQ